LRPRRTDAQMDEILGINIIRIPVAGHRCHHPGGVVATAARPRPRAAVTTACLRGPASERPYGGAARAW
jgi:hypothetical protein